MHVIPSFPNTCPPICCLATGTSQSMPPLLYTGPIETNTFDSTGGKLYLFHSDFTIDVPPNAVPKGKTITIKVGTCSHGSFILPNDCFLITGVFCVIADIEFLSPVRVAMQHCMELPEYKRTPQILLMRADPSDITALGDYIFSLVDNSDVSDRLPHLFYLTMQFCMLCAVYKPHSSRRLERSESSNDFTSELATHLKGKLRLMFHPLMESPHHLHSQV